eukprot:scaffold67115_cov19-Tisochrysis_lutea.AAC.5
MLTSGGRGALRHLRCVSALDADFWRQESVSARLIALQRTRKDVDSQRCWERRRSPEPAPVQPAAPAEDVEMEVDMEEEEEEPIKVVKNYVRPAPTGMRMLHGQVYDPTKFAVSPITVLDRLGCNPTKFAVLPSTGVLAGACICAS